MAWPLVGMSQTTSAPPEEGVLAEITVTAQKRSENLQKVPIAITAFSEATLEAKGLSNISELGNFSPNVSITSTSSFSGSNQVLSAFIRGIGQSDFAFNLDPGVGVYVDGVYFARTIGSVVDLLDVDHIEVLKGPQGTLFGRNTIGGAISVVTRRPAEESTARGVVTGGQYDRLDVRGVVDMPLIQGTLLSQVAFSSKSRAGYFKQLTLPGNYVNDATLFSRPDSTTYSAAGGENNQNARGKLEWRVSEAARVTLSGDYTHVDEEPTPSKLLAIKHGLLDVYNTCINTPAATLATTPLAAVCNAPRSSVGGPIAPLGGANVDGNPYTRRLTVDNSLLWPGLDYGYATGAGYSKVDVFGTSVITDVDFNKAVSLKSISAYRHLDSKFALDVDGTPLPLGDHAFAMNQEQVSEELQFTGQSFDDALHWVAGLYGFHEHGGLTDYVHFAGGLLQIQGPNQFSTSAYAAYTQLNYAFNEKFGAIVGGRYTREDKDFMGGQRDLNSLANKLGFPSSLQPDPNDTTLYFPMGLNKRSFSNFSPKLGLDYHVTDDVLSYLSFTEGFKSGGWTTRATVPILVAPTFNPEKAKTFELGLKGDFLNRRFQSNLAIFYTNYTDLQVTVYSGISPVTENAAQSHIKGAELELQAVATDQLRVGATLGYIDAQYTELSPGTQLQKGFLFFNTPKESASLTADYTVPVRSDREIVLHGDYSFRTKVANDAENTPELMAKAQSLVSAAITLRQDDGKWRATLGGHNLTDRRYVISGQNQAGIGYIAGTYSRPREWYATVAYGF